MTEPNGPAPKKAKKDRSPSFPFIPLQVAIDRLASFEQKFGRHPTPANKAGLAWGMKEQSSQADQTLAALRSFGLVQYQGAGSDREVTISEEGRNYLRVQQESTKEEILKICALRPKVMRKFWAKWGADRPIDPIALDALILKEGFSDKGALAFLKVYDATVSFAKLSTADKVSEPDDEDEDEGGPVADRDTPPPPPPPGGKVRQQVKVMDGERELTTGLLSRNASFRLIVSGNVGVKEIERLISKLEFDKEILADTEDGVPPEDDIFD